MGKPHRLAPCIRPEQLDEMDAAAQVTPQDLAAAQEFWSHWGTPLLNALLNAEAEPEVIMEQTGRCGGGNQA